jgi:hypothetical protein
MPAPSVRLAIKELTKGPTMHADVTAAEQAEQPTRSWQEAEDATTSWADLERRFGRWENVPDASQECRED